MAESERGTTLTEVLVVLALSAMIMTPLYIVLLSGYRAEQAQSDEVDAEAQLERVAVRIEDDIRSGFPSERRTLSAADELAIGRLDNESLQIVLWSFADGELRRRAIDASTGKVVSDVVLAENIDGDRSGFRYWAADGTELEPTWTEGIVRCAVRVTVDLQTKLDVADAGRTIDVAHRITNPEAEPC